MTVAEELLKNDMPHGKFCIGFTPDEEVGRGADEFDIAAFGAEFAYTLDGSVAEEIVYENFNACGASFVINGVNIHPGDAKDKMVNASILAMEINQMLPACDRPEHTEMYEGFYHLCGMKGEEQEAELVYIIRDHDRNKFEQKKERIQKIAAYLNDKYGEGTFELTLKDSYFNMREKVEEKIEVVDRALAALRACGFEPRCVPIRGGTDGARLSFMGLICPNLGTGGRNGHGVYEYASVNEMKGMVDVLKKLVLA